MPEPLPRHRLTVRARLAASYAGLVTLAGVILLAIVSIFIVTVPSYSFGDTATLIAQQYPAELESVPLEAPAMPEGAEPAAVAVYPSLLLPSAQTITVGSRDDMLRLLLGVSAVALLVLAVAGAGTGWLVAGRMLRPLQYVNAAAHRAATGRFDHRIGLAGPRDEISDLADTVDEMLGEVERSLESQRRFAANASHELRTPLATTRAMLDVALRSPGSARERDLLVRLRATNERSLDTVESLLDLAEIEAAVPSTTRVDLTGLAGSVLDECAPEAADARVELHREIDPVAVDGTAVLLRQLLVNLVQNAIRHNQPVGSATVRIRRDGSSAVIEVSNTGAVIAEEAVQNLADPFVRGRGRTSDAGARGRGLGLSIVSAITDRHGGALALSARAGGGLRARVTLPGVRAEEPF